MLDPARRNSSLSLNPFLWYSCAAVGMSRNPSPEQMLLFLELSREIERRKTREKSSRTRRERPNQSSRVLPSPLLISPRSSSILFDPSRSSASSSASLNRQGPKEKERFLAFGVPSLLDQSSFLPAALSCPQKHLSTSLAVLKYFPGALASKPSFLPLSQV